MHKYALMPAVVTMRAGQARRLPPPTVQQKRHDASNVVSASVLRKQRRNGESMQHSK